MMGYLLSLLLLDQPLPVHERVILLLGSFLAGPTTVGSWEVAAIVQGYLLGRFTGSDVEEFTVAICMLESRRLQ